MQNLLMDSTLSGMPNDRLQSYYHAVVLFKRWAIIRINTKINFVCTQLVIHCKDAVLK